MAQRFDLIVHGGTVVTAVGHGHADIGISGGHIVEIGNLARADAVERLDAQGLHVLPGVIDSQVHFREPGNEHKEDLASGTAAAALGGVTAVFEMPNTNPSTTNPEALADKVARGHHHSVHYLAWNPNTHQIVTTTKDGTIRSWNAQTGELDWVTVLLRNHQAATFHANGTLKSGNAEMVNREFVYVLDNGDGDVRMLTPSQAFKRTDQSPFSFYFGFGR